MRDVRLVLATEALPPVIPLPCAESRSLAGMSFDPSSMPGVAVVAVQPPINAALAAALDHHAIVAITDRHGAIIHVNDHFCAISGYTREELLGQDHRLLNSGLHPRQYMREMWRTILKGGIWHGEFCNRAKSGRLYWVQSTIVPVAGPDGRPHEFIAIRTEISEQKRITAELERSELRFRRLFAQSSDALLLLDVDRGCFVDANPAAARMLGLQDPAALLGLSPEALSPARQEDGLESAGKAPDMIAAALSQGSHRFEWWHCSEKRAPFPVEVLLTPIALEGQRLLFVTWRDISARRQHDEWMRCSSQVLDLLVRRASLAEVLSILLDFAISQQPGLGLAVLRHSRISLQPEVVLARGLDPALLSGLIEQREWPCPLLMQGIAKCPTECAREGGCETLLAIRERGHLHVEFISATDQVERASLVSILPVDQPHPAERIGITLREQWLDLLRLSVEKAATRETEALFRAVFESSADGIAVCDRSGRLLLGNPALGRMLGHPASALPGKRLEDAYTDPADPRIERSLAREGYWHGQRTAVDAMGQTATWLCAISEVRESEQGSGQRVVLLTDVSAQETQRKRIEYLAYYDALTQLPNRVLLKERLDTMLARAQRHAGEVALLFVDLDHFKEVNDSCGHTVGDRVLVDVGRRLASALGGTALLARMGGDEFVIAAEGVGADAVNALATKVLRALEPPICVDERGFRLSASIGASLYPLDASDADELMRHADIAMYQAKRLRGGLCLYRSEHGIDLDRRVLIDTRLKAAIEEGRVRLHYQPLVGLDNGKLSGAEALLRWHEPDLGWVDTQEFVRVAEASGTMRALGDFVLNHACAQLAAWRHEGCGLPGRLSINLSPTQLNAPDFEACLSAVLDHHRIRPAEIELELTESTLIGDPEAAIRLFERLVQSGHSLAIDDFGTGYSSLVYLKRFPASRLKIDSQFVRDMLTDSNDAAIVETVLAMARSLRLDTVAEGVESQAHARRLRELGCHIAQGYLYAPALSAEVFAREWL